MPARSKASTKKPKDPCAELKRKLKERDAELNEAREQQAAISEILRVIGSSPTDTQPVFDVIAERATQLCDSKIGFVFTYDGEWIHSAAWYGLDTEAVAAAQKLLPMRPSGHSISGRTVCDGTVVHVPDVLADPEYRFSDASKLAGYRSGLGVPMWRENRIVGGIVVLGADVGVFSDKRVELLKTFADQAVIAIENVRLFNETKEALQQQTVIGEILRIISSSPTDTQPVFDAIVKSGVQLFGGMIMSLRLISGDHTVTVASTTPIGDDSGDDFPFPLTNLGSAGTRAIARREVIQVADFLDAEEWVSPLSKKRAELRGYRAAMCAPMLREGRAIGTGVVTRAMPGAFTDKQIALLQTFADQAVIAIENVRLFKELQARNAELTESLEQQTATAEILRAISASPTDTQPVFDEIAKSCQRLFHGKTVVLGLRRGEQIEVAANIDEGSAGATPFPQSIPLDRSSVSGACILDARIIHVPDYEAVVTEFPRVQALGLSHGFRSGLFVPLLHQGKCIGVLVVRRGVTGAFAQKEIALLQTFADQAVIAIENVRLFKELQARNADLSESLERQTATAEILRVISSSPDDVTPVFETIMESAARLCNGPTAAIYHFDGTLVHLVATKNWPPKALEKLRADYPRVPTPELMNGRVILTGQVCHIEDTRSDAGYDQAHAVMGEWRRILGVPLIREGRTIGAFVAAWPTPGKTAERHVALLSTFTDQAVIAIENVRLFKELQSQTEALSRSVSQLTALGEVGRAISSTLDLQTVLQTIVSRALQLTGLDSGSIYEYDQDVQVFRLQAAEHMDNEIIEAVRKTPIRMGDGIVGRSGVTRELTQVPDILGETYQSARRDLLVRSGYRALLAVPLLRDEHLLGVLLVSRKSPGTFAPEIVDLLKTFATQSAMAIQNARLFREIEEKGRQLEVASQHKSQFLASMSHELRTPLNAMLGFNEMILGEIYGPLSPDLKEPLTDIQSSGNHLLRLINNVLDLAKIEAGRMELSLADYSVHETVEGVRSTLHPLAAEKGLEFTVSVPEDIPFAHGDFGRITQCLMNLAGNSLKFTRSGGVRISVDRKGDFLVYRVTDTGIGIAPDKIDSLFTEFKQTDAAVASEFGGTGLGLSITKKFVEMHGGHVWVESALGKGSVFIFEIPLRAGEGANA